MLPIQKRRAQKIFSSMAKDIFLARKRKGWTQKELAMRAKVGVATVQRIEAADTSVKIETLFVVLATLGILQRLEMALSSYRFKEERDMEYAKASTKRQRSVK